MLDYFWMDAPVFRFAPSPNGHLHCGHALSAFLNVQMAADLHGQCLLRIEDIDTIRCTEALIRDMLDDLNWLGLSFAPHVLRQSTRFAQYREALDILEAKGLLYRAYLTRAEVKNYVEEQETRGFIWPRDPDGAPHYPRDELVLSESELNARRASSDAYAVRLDMQSALAQVQTPLSWSEYPCELKSDDMYLKNEIKADPSAWGDVVLARKDTPTSYHLSVVVDDAFQGVSDVLRGRDLQAATSVHRLLQELLDLPEPRYRHHHLVRTNEGRKLSKSARDVSLRELRASGCRADDILQYIGLCECEENQAWPHEV